MIELDNYPQRVEHYDSSDDLYSLSLYKRTAEDMDAIGNSLLTKLTEDLPEVNSNKKEVILDIRYHNSPVYRNRKINDGDKDVVLYSKTGYTLYDDKRKYPSIFDNEFIVAVKTNKRQFFFPIYSRYRWNNADIIGPVQILAACGKDDRRIILASGLHDFMIEYNQLVFNLIKKNETCYDMKVADYRWITSEVLRFVMETQGMSHFQASVMSNTVDFFQKYCNKKKWKLVYNFNRKEAL